MLNNRLPTLLLATTALTAALATAPAAAQSAASVTVDRQLPYRTTTLTISGTATCSGGGTAGIDVTNGSLEQMFQGGVGGPIAIRLDSAVLVDCDDTTQHWSGNLYAPGRLLPTNSGGTVTVNLTQGSTVIATTGAQGVYIVS
ncbi:hypothetical protein [Nocardia yamanashiensis]|uniref:hypothetical protein n=1 Tax=Nocardia yamanashiensis TaxID=209247 RepID=UPI000835878E|nr:hypothetical protein [Nocardia yamanashiensis]